jgi:hypothetical protein
MHCTKFFLLPCRILTMEIIVLPFPGGIYMLKCSQSDTTHFSSTVLSASRLGFCVNYIFSIAAHRPPRRSWCRTGSLPPRAPCAGFPAGTCVYITKAAALASRTQTYLCFASFSVVMTTISSAAAITCSALLSVVAILQIMKISTRGFILACASLSSLIFLFYYSRALMHWLTGAVSVHSVLVSVFAAGTLLSVVSCVIIWFVAGPAKGVVSIVLSLPHEMALLWWCVLY